jgi:hypothetical protein
VKPGSTLSLQKHFHRSEHSVVVKGTAEVTQRGAHRARERVDLHPHAWWTAAGIDPLKVAQKLWKEARVNEGRIAASPPSQPGDRAQIPEAHDPSGPAPA